MCDSWIIDDATGETAAEYLHTRHDTTRRTSTSTPARVHDGDGDNLLNPAAVGARLCDGFKLLNGTGGAE